MVREKKVPTRAFKCVCSDGIVKVRAVDADAAKAAVEATGKTVTEVLIARKLKSEMPKKDKVPVDPVVPTVPAEQVVDD